MQLRAFLAALAPVAARQPKVFVEACRATVDIKGELRVGWQVLVDVTSCFAGKVFGEGPR